MKLFAPIITFITEEIYQEYFKKHEKVNSIHLSEWPKKFKIKQNENDGKKLDMLIKFNGEVWKKKKESGIALRDKIKGISIPNELKPFEKDLRMTHNLV